MTHTTGPWIKSKTDKGQPCVKSKHGGLVAICEAGYQSMREADANLIATAPELLEACKTAIKPLLEKYNTTGLTMPERVLFDILQAAIQKAERR